jgi:uncharacterized membrane protein
MTLMDQTLGQRSAGSERQQGRAGGQSGGQQTQPQEQTRPVNVGEGERAVSVAAGSVLALLGLSRRSLPGLLIAGAGGAMLYRGATGHCPVYQALGLDTVHPKPVPSYLAGDPENDGLSEHGIHVELVFLINRPAQQWYGYWRDFSNLPRIMSHLDRVEVKDDRHSHWVAKANVAGGKQFQWDAEITHDEPDTLIGWRSLPGADIDNAGQIRFSPAIGDRGTEVHVFIDYVPPGGRLGHWIASMLGQNPRRVVREDLRNFKRIMEIGEVPTIDGQPHGTCRGQGERQHESEWKPLFT